MHGNCEWNGNVRGNLPTKCAYLARPPVFCQPFSLFKPDEMKIALLDTGSRQLHNTVRNSWAHKSTEESSPIEILRWNQTKSLTLWVVIFHRAFAFESKGNKVSTQKWNSAKKSGKAANLPRASNPRHPMICSMSRWLDECTAMIVFALDVVCLCVCVCDRYAKAITVWACWHCRRYQQQFHELPSIAFNAPSGSLRIECLMLNAIQYWLMNSILFTNKFHSAWRVIQWPKA